MRKLIAASVALVTVLLLVACTPEEANHLAAVDDFRAVNNLPALTWDEGIYAAARNWSQHLADAGALSHPSNLAADFNPPAGWHKLGSRTTCT